MRDSVTEFMNELSFLALQRVKRARDLNDHFQRAEEGISQVPEQGSTEQNQGGGLRTSRMFGDLMRKAREEEKIRSEKENWIIQSMKTVKQLMPEAKESVYFGCIEIMKSINPLFKKHLSLAEYRQSFDFSKILGELFQSFFAPFEKVYEFKTSLKSFLKSSNASQIQDMLKYLLEFSRDYFTSFLAFWREHFKAKQIEMIYKLQQARLAENVNQSSLLLQEEPNSPQKQQTQVNNNNKIMNTTRKSVSPVKKNNAIETSWTGLPNTRDPEIQPKRVSETLRFTNPSVNCQQWLKSKDTWGQVTMPYDPNSLYEIMQEVDQVSLNVAIFRQKKFRESMQQEKPSFVYSEEVQLMRGLFDSCYERNWNISNQIQKHLTMIHDSYMNSSSFRKHAGHAYEQSIKQSALDANNAHRLVVRMQKFRLLFARRYQNRLDLPISQPHIEQALSQNQNNSQLPIQKQNQQKLPIKPQENKTLQIEENAKEEGEGQDQEIEEVQEEQILRELNSQKSNEDDINDMNNEQNREINKQEQNMSLLNGWDIYDQGGDAFNEEIEEFTDENFIDRYSEQLYLSSPKQYHRQQQSLQLQQEEQKQSTHNQQEQNYQEENNHSISPSFSPIIRRSEQHPSSQWSIQYDDIEGMNQKSYFNRISKSSINSRRNTLLKEQYSIPQSEMNSQINDINAEQNNQHTYQEDNGFSSSPQQQSIDIKAQTEEEQEEKISLRNNKEYGLKSHQESNQSTARTQNEQVIKVLSLNSNKHKKSKLKSKSKEKRKDSKERKNSERLITKSSTKIIIVPNKQQNTPLKSAEASKPSITIPQNAKSPAEISSKLQLNLTTKIQTESTSVEDSTQIKAIKGSSQLQHMQQLNMKDIQKQKEPVLKAQAPASQKTDSQISELLTKQEDIKQKQFQKIETASKNENPPSSSSTSDPKLKLFPKSLVISPLASNLSILNKNFLFSSKILQTVVNPPPENISLSPKKSPSQETKIKEMFLKKERKTLVELSRPSFDRIEDHQIKGIEIQHQLTPKESIKTPRSQQLVKLMKQDSKQLVPLIPCPKIQETELDAPKIEQQINAQQLEDSKAENFIFNQQTSFPAMNFKNPYQKQMNSPIKNKQQQDLPTKIIRVQAGSCSSAFLKPIDDSPFQGSIKQLVENSESTPKTNSIVFAASDKQQETTNPHQSAQPSPQLQKLNTNQKSSTNFFGFGSLLSSGVCIFEETQKGSLLASKSKQAIKKKSPVQVYAEAVMKARREEPFRILSTDGILSSTSSIDKLCKDPSFSQLRKNSQNSSQNGVQCYSIASRVNQSCNNLKKRLIDQSTTGNLSCHSNIFNGHKIDDQTITQTAFTITSANNNSQLNDSTLNHNKDNHHSMSSTTSKRYFFNRSGTISPPKFATRRISQQIYQQSQQQSDGEIEQETHQEQQINAIESLPLIESSNCIEQEIQNNSSRMKLQRVAQQQQKSTDKNNISSQQFKSSSDKSNINSSTNAFCDIALADNLSQHREGSYLPYKQREIFQQQTHHRGNGSHGNMKSLVEVGDNTAEMKQQLQQQSRYNKNLIEISDDKLNIYKQISITSSSNNTLGLFSNSRLQQAAHSKRSQQQLLNNNINAQPQQSQQSHNYLNSIDKQSSRDQSPFLKQQLSSQVIEKQISREQQRDMSQQSSNQNGKNNGSQSTKINQTNQLLIPLQNQYNTPPKQSLKKAILPKEPGWNGLYKSFKRLN